MNNDVLKKNLDYILPIAKTYTSSETKAQNDSNSIEFIISTVLEKSPETVSLETALEAFSEEDLLALVCVMYVGREGYEEITTEKAWQLFERYRKDFSSWEKLGYISKLLEKMRLSHFLNRGRQLLDI